MKRKRDEVDHAADEAAADRRQQKDQWRRCLDAGKDQQTGVGGADGGSGIGQVELVHHAEDEREADPQ